MTYGIEIDARAAKELVSFGKDTVRRIHETLRALMEQPRPPGARKLSGREGYRVRVGDYRILYEIDDPTHLVRVYTIGHRREVYR